jgi:hypothetical protein
MNVRELIEALSQLDPETRVVGENQNTEGLTSEDLMGGWGQKQSVSEED